MFESRDGSRPTSSGFAIRGMMFIRFSLGYLSVCSVLAGRGEKRTEKLPGAAPPRHHGACVVRAYRNRFPALRRLSQTKAGPQVSAARQVGCENALRILAELEIERGPLGGLCQPPPVMF